MTPTTLQLVCHIYGKWDLDATIIHRILSLPDRTCRLLQLLKKELKLLICNAIISYKCSTIW